MISLQAVARFTTTTSFSPPRSRLFRFILYPFAFILLDCPHAWRFPPVIVHNADEGGYWVEVPLLPGCYSQGETIDEALSNVREAIEVHLQRLKDDGQEVPKDEGFVIGRVEVKAA
jgi:predicted RNase H-like HicB family nuclease